MNFKKKYSKVTVLLALGQGVLLGIAAVAIVGFILLKTEKPEAGSAVPTETPASGPAAVPPKKDNQNNAAVSAIGAPITMYAKQHGVFSSKQAAAQFLAEKKMTHGAAVKVDSQYYVWSAIGLMESDADPGSEEGVFRKTVSATPLACSSGDGVLLQKVLQAQQSSEIQILANEQKKLPAGKKQTTFLEQINAITAFTDNISTIKVHLLAKYSDSGECVKIQF